MDLTFNKRTGTMVGALALLAGYSVYTNLLSGPDVPAASTSTRSVPAEQPAANLPAQPGPARPRPPRAPASRGRSDEWRPVVLAKRPEDRPDPKTIDPTLHWELFAKVQEVPPAGGSRNLFQFGQAPPKEVPKQLAMAAEPKIRPFVGPRAPAPPPPLPPPPPPPPITLKFYGWSMTTAAGKRMGYFLDGEEILLAGEGDTLKRRYKIVRIGPGSALVEDMDAKRQQSVPLTEEGQG
jgi:hypothetical protein